MDKKCPKCQATVAAATKFCTECGFKFEASTPQPSKLVACVQCGFAMSPGAKFCTQCGAQMGGEPVQSQQSSDSKGLWHRESGVFARRIESSQLHQRIDIKGGQLQKLLRKGVNAVINNIFGKEINIPAGTRGLVFQNENQVGEIASGKHKVDDVAFFLQEVNFNLPYTLLLTGSGDIEMPVRINDLRTRDEQTTDASISLVAELKDASSFMHNVMGTGDSVTITTLAKRIGKELVSVMQSIIHTCDAEELYGNLELVARIEDELRKSLDRSLIRFGLGLTQVRFVSFRGDDFESVRNAQGDLSHDVAMGEVEARRLEFEKTLRERLTDEKMSKIQSAQELVEFVEQVAHDAQVKELLREQEIHELRRQYEESKADHTLCREHLLAVLKLQRERELVPLRRELEREELLKNKELDEITREHELAEIDARHQSEMDRSQREFDQKINQHRQASQLKQEERQAEVDAEFESDKREAELAMNLLKQTKDLKRAEADAEHRRELEKMETYNTMSTEALVAASDKDKAAILAELKKTETLKDMTEEQILAMAADKSPEVAKAFGEKFKAAGGEEQRQQMEKMYERMLEEQKTSGDKMIQMQSENAAMLKEIMTKALETQRDVSSAAASSGSHPVVVSSPQAPGAPASQPPTPAKVIFCRDCGAKSPLGSEFCGECGRKL